MCVPAKRINFTSLILRQPFEPPNNNWYQFQNTRFLFSLFVVFSSKLPFRCRYVIIGSHLLFMYIGLHITVTLYHYLALGITLYTTCFFFTSYTLPFTPTITHTMYPYHYPYSTVCVKVAPLTSLIMYLLGC